jgi:hypothetical protein
MIVHCVDKEKFRQTAFSGDPKQRAALTVCRALPEPGRLQESIGLSFGTVYILVRQALAAREMTSPSQVSVLQRKAEARRPRSVVDR